MISTTIVDALRESRKLGPCLQAEEAESLSVHVDREPALGEGRGEQSPEWREGDQPKRTRSQSRRQSRYPREGGEGMCGRRVHGFNLARTKATDKDPYCGADIGENPLWTLIAAALAHMMRAPRCE